MSLYGCQVCQGFLDLFSQNSVPAFVFLHFHASVFYILWQPRRVSVGRLSPRRSRPRVSPPPPGGYLRPHHISTYPQPLLGRDVHLHQEDISTCTLQYPAKISTPTISPPTPTTTRKRCPPPPGGYLYMHPTIPGRNLHPTSTLPHHFSILKRQIFPPPPFLHLPQPIPGGYLYIPGPHNLRSFLAANSTQNYFLIAHMKVF